MRKLAAIAVLGLICACRSSAQTTTYSFNWTGGGAADSSGDSLVMNVPDVNTTQVSILTAGLANGCDSDQVYSYAPVSGPALVVGEWVKVVLGNLPAYSGNFQITALGTDANGNPTFTVNHLSCFSGGSGTAWAGPSANPFFYLSTPAYNWEYGANCDPSKSVFHFTLLHTDGTLSQEMSTPNTVTCSIPHNPTTRNVTLTGSFSSTLTTGETVTGTFTTSGYIGLCKCYLSGKYIATSASWTITSPTPIDTLVGGGTGGGGQ